MLAASASIHPRQFSQDTQMHYGHYSNNVSPNSQTGVVPGNAPHTSAGPTFTNLAS